MRRDRAPALPAYLARPDTDGTFPLVVVGFEMFGVTGYVRRVAERIAQLGYTAAVPDFYHRLTGKHVELAADDDGRARGRELLAGLARDGVLDDVRAVLQELGGQQDGRRAGFVGLSVGGHVGYYVATQLPFGALAAFYPGWLTDTDVPLSRPEPTLSLTRRLADAGTAVLVLVGESDHLVTPAQQAQIAEQLRAAGVAHELVVYPAAPHGFFCDERDTYRHEAAQDAWRRLTALLSAALPTPPR